MDEGKAPNTTNETCDVSAAIEADGARVLFGRYGWLVEAAEHLVQHDEQDERNAKHAYSDDGQHDQLVFGPAVALPPETSMYIRLEERKIIDCASGWWIVRVGKKKRPNSDAANDDMVGDA